MTTRKLEFSGLVMFLMYFSSFSEAVSQITACLAQMQEAKIGDARIQEFKGLDPITDEDRMLPNYLIEPFEDDEKMMGRAVIL